MTVLEKIRQSENFTDTENAIIQFLLKSSGQIEKIKIQDIVNASYSSKTSVIRFCQKLGYEGFREFKAAYIRETEASKYVVNTVDYTRPFEPQASTAEIVNSIYSLYRESMELMQSQLDITELERMADGMFRANRIFLYGIGDVKTILQTFMNMLLKIGCFPILATDNGEEGHISTFITKEDCALFVTYSGNYARYQSCTKILKRNHVPILLLTANPKSALYKLSTCRICVPNQEDKDNIATFYSQHVFGYLLNLLYSLMFKKYKTENRIS